MDEATLYMLAGLLLAGVVIFALLRVSDADRCILTAWGQGGVGKSGLLARMIHEVARAGLRKSEVVWTDNRNHDYLAVMRKVRHDIDVIRFNAFTELVNGFTMPRSQLDINLQANGLHLLEGASLKDSRVGSVTGIVIQDLMLTQPRSDMAIPEDERVARLTDSFKTCLRSALAQAPAILFFDAAEKMNAKTAAWLWGELLPAVRDGDLPGLKVALLGRNHLRLDRSWRVAVGGIELAPLEGCHVEEYLRKRGIKTSVSELARMPIIASKGNMLDLATLVDAYLEQAA